MSDIYHLLERPKKGAWILKVLPEVDKTKLLDHNELFYKYEQGFIDKEELTGANDAPTTKKKRGK